VLRVLGYHASRDLVPLYGVYALLFGAHGVSGPSISALFVIWSVTGFLCEVPSGAWADTVDRRLLLVVSALLYAMGFSCWLLWPVFAGFAAGFVLWGLSGALMSGTFESLLWSEMAARNVSVLYPRLVGWAHSAATTANLVATLSASVLFDLGGFALVGWASVGIALVQAVLALTLPVSSLARRPSSTASPGHYLVMLRSGVREASASMDVRRAILLAAGLVGLTAYDEYFPLVARGHGVPVGVVPTLVAVTVLGQAIGTALAGRSTRSSPRRLAAGVAAGGVLVSAGALVTPYAGFPLIAVGYGLLNNRMIVAEARLQEVIGGPARATVTSVHGLLTEVVALAVYGAFALGSSALGFPDLVALLGIPVLAIGWAAWRWLPRQR
jgi:hypothetical protein